MITSNIYEPFTVFKKIYQCYLAFKTENAWEEITFWGKEFEILTTLLEKKNITAVKQSDIEKRFLIVPASPAKEKSKEFLGV